MPASLANDAFLIDLYRHGYAVLRGAGVAGFEALSSVLGAPLRTTHVRLDPQEGTYLTSPGSIPLHTDHPLVHSIAWLCIEQDDEDGAMVLADLRGMPAELSAMALAAEAPCPCLDSTRARSTHPLLQKGRWYFPDWHVRADPAMADLVAAVDSLPRFEIQLEKDDVLVIDNGRILHGRRRLARDSCRHLGRHWYAAPVAAACECVA